MAWRALSLKLMYGLSREAIEPSFAVNPVLWHHSADRRQHRKPQVTAPNKLGEWM
jgi:hypothetical protein